MEFRNVPKISSNPDNKPTTHFLISRLQGGEETWDTYGLRLADILARSTRDELPRMVINELVGDLADSFNDKRATILLLKNDSEEIVGYSSWYQAAFTRHWIWSEPFQIHEDRELNRGELKDIHTVMGEVGWTAILPEYQDQGGWSLLMNTVEEDLRSNGYRYMLRGIRTASRYEESIERRYRERILFKSVPIEQFYPVTCYVIAL